MKNYYAGIKFLSLVLLFCCTSIVFGQRTISGVVMDATSNERLIGANVLVKGSTIGTVSDIDGSFSMRLTSDAKSLIISYTGYEDKEIALDGSNEYVISLSAGKLLNEVVVIGYGTIERDDATGSIQSVTSKDFNRGAITGPQELLSGKVAGVSITNSGDPGGGAKIRIRGESSLNANNDPLIVIDGVPLEGGGINGNRNPLDIINPNEIESFTVLKDASATAIYGNRAAGGVILITTKKGKSNENLRVGYVGNVSVGQISNKVDVLSPSEYRNVINQYFEGNDTALERLGDANTDWQDEIYDSAFGHEHNLNFMGGIAKLPYRLSVGYLDKKGVLLNDQYSRSSLGLNINPGYLDNRLQLNFGVKGSWAKNRFADRGAIGNALSFDPTQSPLSDTTSWGGYTTWLDGNGVPEFIAPTNPLALLELKEDRSNVNRILLNASADYRFAFMPELRANLNIATDRVNSDGTVMIDTTASFAYDPLTGGGINNTYEQNKQNDLLEFYLNYKKDLDIHGLDLMAGYSWQFFKDESSFMNSDFNGTESETTMGSDGSELYLVSLFGRLNYSFQERYLLTLSLRRDGTSRFSPENRWGMFPAAALAIKLIDNDNTKFNRAKLRLGWGVTGQEGIGNRYAYLPQYTFGFENAAYQFGDQFIQTLRAEGYDSNIKWEETSTLNVGLDFSIVKDRLSGSLDLYRRDTKDLLNRIPVPAGTNLTNFITTNVGDMENKGVELSLNLTPIKKENLSWDVAFNAAYNENEITKLTATDDPEYQGIQVGGIAGGVGSNIQIHSVGFSPFAFYVKEQLYDENGALLEGQFADLNGDETDNDFYRIHKPAADFSFGLTSNLNIGKLGFSFAARALTGNYIYNNVKTDMGYLNRMVTSTNVLYNIHQSAVDLEVFEQGNLTFSDAFIQDATFLRVDHLTLSYSLGDVIGKNASIYFTIQNPLLFTSYDGLDPEVGNGIDNNVYPRPRTFVFGWNVQF